jgi:hypothetical protein
MAASSIECNPLSPLAVRWVFGLLAAAGAAGCSGAIARPTDPGTPDGSVLDAGSACTPADCAVLGATQEAKVCPDGTAVGRTVCARLANDRCGWDFPACPSPDAASCQCSGPAPTSPTTQCSDGSTGGPTCASHADGTCVWEIRACPTPCPALGCLPNCANGVVKDSHGCDTCQCAPAPEGGSTACNSDVNCPSGQACGFPVSSGCAATGACVAHSPVTCLAFSQGCACDGSQISTICNGLPSGDASKPFSHSGPCTDGGSSDSGGGCVSPQGGPCGGNTTRPCTCAPNLVCTPHDGGPPFGDVGGTCLPGH